MACSARSGPLRLKDQTVRNGRAAEGKKGSHGHGTSQKNKWGPDKFILNFLFIFCVSHIVTFYSAL